MTVSPIEAAPPAGDATTHSTTGLGRAFIWLWAGQMISITGSMLTSFALAVWIFQRSGSIIDFSGTILFATLPALIVTPWAGSLADRGNKRRLMCICTITAALCTGSVGLLVWLESFQLWHVYLMLTILSASAALRGPATQAMVVHLVSKEQLGRASGMLSISGAAAQIVGPLLGGVLMGVIGLSGIILLDVIGYSFALLSLLALPATKAAPKVAGDEQASSLVGMITHSLRTVWQDNSAAMQFFRQNPALLVVFIFMISAVFMSGMVSVLVTPLVLSVYSETTLAIITTCGAVGALLGGVAMAVWGGPKRFSPWLLGFTVVEGLCVALAGSVVSVPLLCAFAFGAMAASTLMCANVENLWRRKVPQAKQGSVFALEQFMMMAMIPLSVIIGGASVEYLFEPALLPGGMWYDSIGAWFGTGKGRGTGLFFVVVGLAVAGLTLVAMSTRRLRQLEQEVPDVV